MKKSMEKSLLTLQKKCFKSGLYLLGATALVFLMNWQDLEIWRYLWRKKKHKPRQRGQKASGHLLNEILSPWEEGQVQREKY